MRKTTKILTALAAAFVLIPGTDLLAQRRRGLVDVSHRNDRHGLWLNFSLAAGAENYKYANEAGCNGAIGSYQRCESLYKPSIAIAIGGTPSPYLRLGGEINAWFYEYNDPDLGSVTSYLVGGLITGQVFPVRTLGLFGKLGAGISRSGESFDYAGGTGETGFAYMLGAGYEIKLGRNIFLTPSVNLMHHISSIGAGQDIDNLGTFRERVVTFGVGLTWQPGR